MTKKIFIGRRSELELLNNEVDRGMARLVVIRGRRRIGKSRLVEEFVKQNHLKAYTFSGILPVKRTTIKMQLEEFSKQMARNGLPRVVSDDWGDLFWTLASHTSKGRIVIFLDEISWMGSKDAEFLSKLKNAWDLHFKQNPYEMARMGIGLYGISDPQHSELEPVLKLKTKITQIRTIEKGESVGYSRAFIAKDPMRIGVLAIGYADGLMRSYSQPGSVFLKGQRAPIIGNICMDMTMIDLSQIDAKEGDDVEIFGDHISVQEVADKTGTIPYEIFTRISDRVKRVYLD